MTLQPDRALIVGNPTSDLEKREDVAHFIQNSIAENSRRAFKSDLAHFHSWGGSVPASPEMVAAYLSSFAGKLSIATLQRRLASISKAHRLQSFESPVKHELVRLTMRGIQRLHAKPQKRAPPLLKEDLLTLLSCIPNNLKGTRDRALLLIGFAGAFRRSELVAIDCSDLEFTDKGLVIAIQRSKTDQTGQGRKVAIPHARGTVCPVKALRDWLTISGIATGPVFRSVSKKDKLAGCGLTPQSVPLSIQRYTASGESYKGGKQHYSGHSLRAGFVTSAAAQGAPTWKIRAQTGHKSDSMLERYIRDGDIFNNNAAGLMF